MRAVLSACLLACHCAADESAVFPEGSAWETVSEGHKIVEGIAAAPDACIYLTDVPDSELIKLTPDGRRSVLDAATDRANGLAFAPDGRLLGACMGRPAIVVWNLKDGTTERIALPTPANDLAVTKGGSVYHTWGPENSIYQLNLADPAPVRVADMPNPNGITLSPDERELWVGEFTGDTVFAFPILENGKLGPARPAFKAKVPADGRGLLDGMTPLADGRLLVATALGLQILSANDTPLVLTNPTGRRANYVRLVTDAAGLRWIYASHEKSVLRRRARL